MLLFDEEQEKNTLLLEEKEIAACFCAAIGRQHSFCACLSTNPGEREKEKRKKNANKGRSSMKRERK